LLLYWTPVGIQTKTLFESRWLPTTRLRQTFSSSRSEIDRKGGGRPTPEAAGPPYACGSSFQVVTPEGTDSHFIRAWIIPSPYPFDPRQVKGKKEEDNMLPNCPHRGRLACRAREGEKRAGGRWPSATGLEGRSARASRWRGHASGGRRRKD